jgi:hypothetical protein
MDAKFSDLIGKTLVAIKGGAKGDDLLTFITDSGESFTLYHEQDCCESVRIEDVAGDLNDLIDSPILKAEENSNESGPDDYDNTYESYTWTYYILATIKGYVTIRWYGSSNGYYSERVDFRKDN